MMIRKERKPILITFIVVVLYLCGCSTKEQFTSNSLRTDVFVQDYTDHKYDFIWVIDNSGSMIDRIEYVRDNLEDIIDSMSLHKAVNYRMVFVTTDYFTEEGALRQTSGSESVISSSDPLAITKAKDILNIILAEIIANPFSLTPPAPTATSFWERPDDSLYQAINVHGSTFLRNEADAIAILASDEDSYNCGPEWVLGNAPAHCSGVSPEINPAYVRKPKTFYESLYTQFKAQHGRKFSYIPIVAQNLTDCSVDAVGAHYLEILADLVSRISALDVSGNICQSKMAESVSNITSYIANRGLKFTLSRPANGLNIMVAVNGVVVPITSYDFDQATNSIVFNSSGEVPADGTTVQITYGM